MKKNKIYPWYFAFGALIFYIIFFIVPSVIGIGYSFTDWSAYSSELHFVGWDNFKEIFSPERDYLDYIVNTLWFTAAETILKTVLGLGLAVLLSRKISAMNFHRCIAYLPSVLSVLIVSIVFISILNPKNGFLNEFLRAVGLDFLALKWLTDPKIAMWSVIFVDVWRGTGYIMTIFIVGILSIDKTYYEAASIDGASAWHQFRFITLPLLKDTTAMVLVLSVLYGLKVFDMVFALTNGGPGHTTEVLYTAVFKEFSMGRYAVGTAISTVMLVIMIIVGVFMLKVLTKDEVQA